MSEDIQVPARNWYVSRLGQEISPAGRTILSGAEIGCRHQDVNVAVIPHRSITEDELVIKMVQHFTSDQQWLMMEQTL